MARTGYHLADNSPWPVGVALAAMGATSSMVGFFYEGFSNPVIFFMMGSFLMLILCLVGWWGDLIKESTYLGNFTSLVVRNLRLAFALFLVSEAMFFASFFWAFFYFSIGEASMLKVGQWPPVGIKPIGPWGVPLLNTVILLSSGATVTLAHKVIKYHASLQYNPKYSPRGLKVYTDWDIKYSMEQGEKGNTIHFWWWHTVGSLSLAVTVLLGITFTSFQLWEYYMASFSISDGVYGSTFFMLTGLHGLHVIAGTSYLAVCMVRFYLLHFSFKSWCFGLDSAVWYWHFVDIIWIVVWGSVYIFGR